MIALYIHLKVLAFVPISINADYPWSANGSMPRNTIVMEVSELPEGSLEALVSQFGLRCEPVPLGSEIPGSYWGDCEAGLIGDRLFVRGDTPVHSALHEACHFVCMDSARRRALHTDAGGSDTEENAVCYLSCQLADRLEGYSQTRMFRDMDAWGYHFILGSAEAWFWRDSDDAQRWLAMHRSLDGPGNGL